MAKERERGRQGASGWELREGGGGWYLRKNGCVVGMGVRRVLGCVWTGGVVDWCNALASVKIVVIDFMEIMLGIL